MLKIECKDLTNFKINKQDLIKFSGRETLEIGFFENARYENGTQVAQVAFFNEFGTLRIPARPFFRNAITKNIKKWYSTLGSAIRAGRNPNNALSLVGEQARGDIIKSITELNTPPNAQSTINAKGSTSPLIDSGLLRRSVTYKVKQRS